MNQGLLLHIVERLENFLGKLPATIQKPVLHELTPLKELFLQQRPPRFVLIGSNELPVQDLVATLFGWTRPSESRDLLMELFRWQTIELGGHGIIAVLDARGADEIATSTIREQLNDKPADIFLYLADDGPFLRASAGDLENLATFLASNNDRAAEAKVIGVLLHNAAPFSHRVRNGESAPPAQQKTRLAALEKTLQEKQGVRQRLLRVVELSFGDRNGKPAVTDSNRFMAQLARELPNQARVEMIRIARDPAAQIEVAQMLVKSTTAICTAIGAQPIPLADLPILTALQLMMVSGIMYISGRERSMRAATEFVGALGVNVGAGMMLREGTRAVLKFFPGWGNVVCGMVAGAGTYAIGRAAIVYFLEGVSLKDARRIYLTSRKKRATAQLSVAETVESRK